MARDILDEYGPNTDKPQAERAVSGGVFPLDKKDVMNYAPPQGPTTFGHQGPGLAQRNNYGNCGSQGKYSNPASTSGRPGIGGENEGKGTNRG
jgi:hypothetical protein